jgi:signal transduction histidine kinase
MLAGRQEGFEGQRPLTVGGIMPGVRKTGIGQGANRYGTWTVYSIALCSLLVLMLVPSLIALRRGAKLYQDIVGIQENYERNQRLLDSVSRNLLTMSILIREFMLDASAENDALYAQRLKSTRAEIHAGIAGLRDSIGQEDPATFRQLDAELGGYWTKILPVFAWTPQQRAERGVSFLRQEQRPRRQTIMAITDEIDRLNVAIYRDRSARLSESEQKYRQDVYYVMYVVLLAGIGIAAASIFRIASLERRAKQQHEQAKRTGQQMRNLSIRLRHAQEEERKTISRELHDEVGQKLTALCMGLGSLDHSRILGQEDYEDRLAGIKDLAGDSLRMIRDIAAGLRPALLDDLGLVPALQRQAREFTKHTGLPVTLEITGDLDGLPERHRTHIYRIVQESLTNCAKHSAARNVAISINGYPDEVTLTVKDDGTGFDARRLSHSGLGLIGIEERVRELGGNIEIRSRRRKGTAIHISISLKGSSNEQHTFAAGG